MLITYLRVSLAVSWNRGNYFDNTLRRLLNAKATLASGSLYGKRRSPRYELCVVVYVSSIEDGDRRSNDLFQSNIALCFTWALGTFSLTLVRSLKPEFDP